MRRRSFKTSEPDCSTIMVPNTKRLKRTTANQMEKLRKHIAQLYAGYLVTEKVLSGEIPDLEIFSAIAGMLTKTTETRLFLMEMMSMCIRPADRKAGMGGVVKMHMEKERAARRRGR